MPVAKSFQTFEQLCEPYSTSGKMYIQVKNPKTGTIRTVRWYTEKEYAKMYPSEISVTTKKVKTQKEVLGFEKGYITFINRKNFKILCRIQVGMIPIDCIEDDNYIYVSNYGDSTISIINIEQKQEVLKIDVRGAPKAISKYHNSIYYSDYDSGNIYELNLEYEVIKKIASGIEPNAIIVI